MRHEQGFTVVEVIVTVILLSVVTLVTLNFFDTTTSLTGRTSRNVEAEKDGQVALRTITQDIRGANPISATYPTGAICPTGITFSSTPSGYRNCLRFVVVHSATNAFCLDPEVGRVNAPYTRHTYGLVGGKLLHRKTRFGESCAVDTARSYSSLVVLEQIVNSSTQPLFRYYDKAGAEITSLTSTAVTNATAVKVDLFVKYRRDTPVLSLSSVASLRNNRGVTRS